MINLVSKEIWNGIDRTQRSTATKPHLTQYAGYNDEDDADFALRTQGSQLYYFAYYFDVKYTIAKHCLLYDVDIDRICHHN